jgi:bacterioferritin (cytochrome b1)
MTKHDFVKLMNQDLKNELKHMFFYLYSSFSVHGLHRLELGKFLQNAAKSELEHVQEFAKFIVDLGGSPEHVPNDFFPLYGDPKLILQSALDMENEVLKNYTERLHHTDMLGGEDGSALHIFYEDQIMDSRKDANELRQLLCVV